MINREKSILEVLVIMKANPQHFKYGLCKWVYRLCLDGLINGSEYIVVSAYILDHPTAFIKFVKRPLGMDAVFYWPEGDLAPRDIWLDKHIKKLTDKQKRFA